MNKIAIVTLLGLFGLAMTASDAEAKPKLVRNGRTFTLRLTVGEVFKLDFRGAIHVSSSRSSRPDVARTHHTNRPAALYIVGLQRGVSTVVFRWSEAHRRLPTGVIRVIVDGPPVVDYREFKYLRWLGRDKDALEDALKRLASDPRGVKKTGAAEYTVTLYAGDARPLSFPFAVKAGRTTPAVVAAMTQHGMKAVMIHALSPGRALGKVHVTPTAANPKGIVRVVINVLEKPAGHKADFGDAPDAGNGLAGGR